MRDRQPRQVLNNLAWKLATGPKPERDPALAARLAAFSVALAPGEQVSLNTLGVALYRAGKFAEAITTLEKSLDAGKGQFDAFDLFFLAMAHHRLGHRPEARACYDRAVRWLEEQKGSEPATLKGAGGLPRRGRGRAGQSIWRSPGRGIRT